ncbi:MAG: hypothetical protein HZC02_04825 [Candidatus Levybacteria bacterium]|nr:hypothetical protein [Candidatus Levybacteria bacterium]
MKKLLGHRQLFIIFVFFLIADIVLGYFLLSDLRSPLGFLTKTDSLLHQISSNQLNDKTYSQFQKNVASQAQTAGFIEVSGCNFSPKIYRSLSNSQIVFQNSDTKDHFITLPSQKPLRIEAKKSLAVPLPTIPEGSKIFGIGCDKNREAAGIVYIAE